MMPASFLKALCAGHGWFHLRFMNGLRQHKFGLYSLFAEMFNESALKRVCEEVEVALTCTFHIQVWN